MLAVTKTMMLSVVAEASWRLTRDSQLHFFLHINIELLNMFADVFMLLQKNLYGFIRESYGQLQRKPNLYLEWKKLEYFLDLKKVSTVYS